MKDVVVNCIDAVTMFVQWQRLDADASSPAPAFAVVARPSAACDVMPSACAAEVVARFDATDVCPDQMCETQVDVGPVHFSHVWVEALDDVSATPTLSLTQAVPPAIASVSDRRCGGTPLHYQFELRQGYAKRNDEGESESEAEDDAHDEVRMVRCVSYSAAAFLSLFSSSCVSCFWNNGSADTTTNN